MPCPSACAADAVVAIGACGGVATMGDTNREESVTGLNTPASSVMPVRTGGSSTMCELPPLLAREPRVPPFVFFIICRPQALQ